MENKIIDSDISSDLLIDEDMTPEMIEQVEMINVIINTDIIDNTTALKILISVSQSVFSSEMVNDLDRALISKALDSIQNSIDTGCDFCIKLDSTETENDLGDYDDFPSD